MMSIGRNILNLFFPLRCAICDEILPVYEKRNLCGECRSAWLSERRAASEIIDVNGIRFTVMTLCGYSKKRGSIGKSAVLKLKSNMRSDTAEFIASELSNIITQKLGDIAEEKYVITAVPRSKRGIRREGFDQAELVAKKIAEIIGTEYLRLIDNRTEENQKSLDATGRIENARGAYTVRKDALKNISGRKIIIYDDVISTGATIGYCIKALTESGADKVFPICFARTEG